MKGKVCQWQDEKGFGFIQPENGSEKLFFHISSVKTTARRPEVGDSVLYDPTRDSQNRPISCINSGRLSPKSPVVIGFMA